MELENDDGWRNEMGKCIRSVGNLAGTALKRIKRDRARNNLPFDKAFQKYFAKKINARIIDVYTDVSFDESLDGGQSLPNQDGNQRNENGNANILEMPVAMEQLNNQNASVPLVQNDNEVSEQIVISIPSNSLLISRNPEQESHAQSSRTSIPVAFGAREGTNMESLIGPKVNSGTENQSSVRGQLAVESASTSVGSLELHHPLEQITDLNINQLDTIDLTMDHGEMNGATGGEQGKSTVLNVQLRGRCPSKASKNNAHVENRMIISKSQTELLHSQQKTGINVHVSGSPSSNVAEQSNFSQHSKTVSSNNANDAVFADDNNDLELVSEGVIATVPKVNDNHQIGPIALSEIKTEFIPNEATSDIARSDGGKSGNQRLQYPESVDLISDDEETLNQAANNDTNDAQNVVRPTIQGRKRKNGHADANRYLKKKPKLANKRTVDTKKRHKCDFCEYSTNIKTNLNDHIRTHTNERPYRCEVCDKRFTQQQNLNTHMKTHRDMFTFQCSHCRRGFSTEREWKSHESRCKTRGYECHLCKKAFIQKPHLVGHMRAHTGEKMHCPNCRKCFNSNRGLSCHMKSHGKLFRFQCSHCRQGFSNQVSWKLHESRCKSKQYECFLCGKNFYQSKSNLLVHMRHKHTGEKPFGCSNCSKQFCEKSALTRHTKCRH